MEEDLLTLLLPQMVPVVQPAAVVAVLVPQADQVVALEPLALAEVLAAVVSALLPPQCRALPSRGPTKLLVDDVADLQQEVLESPSLVVDQEVSSLQVFVAVLEAALASPVVARM